MDRDQPPDDQPVYFLDKRPFFPSPDRARGDGLLAVGGDLSVPRLLEAYRHGIFPWYEAGGPILWWSPDPRLILEPAGLKVSRSLRAVLRRGVYEVTFDTAFARVIRACASTPRKDEAGTWITSEVESAYTALHELGHAHSVEVWFQGELVGGLYGIHLGRCFFGESMFSHRPDASKVGLAVLVEFLRARETDLIDCQVTSEHLLSLGAREIPRVEFLRRLRRALAHPASPEKWPRSPGIA